MTKNKRFNKNGIPVLDPPKNGRKPNSNCPFCGYWDYDAKRGECKNCYINGQGKYEKQYDYVTDTYY